MSWTSIGHGCAAGAVGVTALNAVTYADMAFRARPASETPSQAVENLAQTAGVQIPGEGQERDNRLAGLGPLSGIATGVAVGVAGSVLLPVLRRLPAPLAAATLGAIAMLAANGPLVTMGLTKPRDWSASDWLSDVVPHLAYGAATYAVLASLDDH